MFNNLRPEVFFGSTFGVIEEVSFWNCVCVYVCVVTRSTQIKHHWQEVFNLIKLGIEECFHCVYSFLLWSTFLAASRSFASSVVMFTDATMPCMTLMIVLTTATGAEMIAINLNNGTPRTKKKTKKKFLRNNCMFKGQTVYREVRVWNTADRVQHRTARWTDTWSPARYGWCSRCAWLGSRSCRWTCEMFFPARLFCKQRKFYCATNKGAIKRLRMQVEPVTRHINGHRKLKPKHVLRIEVTEGDEQSHSAAPIR